MNNYSTNIINMTVPNRARETWPSFSSPFQLSNCIFVSPWNGFSRQHVNPSLAFHPHHRNPLALRCYPLLLPTDCSFTEAQRLPPFVCTRFLRSSFSNPLPEKREKCVTFIHGEKYVYRNDALFIRFRDHSNSSLLEMWSFWSEAVKFKQIL